MSEEHTIPSSEIEPPRTEILALLGIPEDADLTAEIRQILDRCLVLFRDTAEGRGLTAGLDGDAFAAVFSGSGENESDTPLEHIFPRAEALALYAVTIGARISEEITRLFDTGEYAAGSILDAVASAGTERLADRVQQIWLTESGFTGPPTAGCAALRYSPGYCGWHVSGQHALFAALEPERIGIDLLESSLMQPRKSTTGVIVVGERAIHVIDPLFPCCASCAYPTCRDRVAELFRGGNDLAS